MDTNLISVAPSSIDEIKPKMHFTGTVVKTTLAGAIIDVGLGTPGVVHISQLQKEPVKRVEDIVNVGQTVDVWVRRVFPKKNRIDLTMVKPLDLEWNEIKKDMVVSGKVVRLEKFGLFVDIGAERPGLVHISEITHGYIRKPEDVVKEGDVVEVKVIDVIRQKKQIKLSMKALEEKPEDVVQAALAKPAPKERDKEKTKESDSSAEEKELPVPTAMEQALRQAMERSKTSEPANSGKKKSSGANHELEGILTRTLKNKSSK